MIKEFTLGAVKWAVEINDLKGDDKECYGTCSYDESKIYIQEKTLGKQRTQESIDQTLYHEVIHSILDTLGKHELSNDEEFVQTFSLLLHQFEITKK